MRVLLICLALSTVLGKRMLSDWNKCSPISVAHGSVSYSKNRDANGLYIWQTRATVTCNSGYGRSKTNPRCQSGSWKGGVPTCEALYTTIGDGYCKGNGFHNEAGVRKIWKNYWVTAKECKSMCSSLDVCAGYSFRPTKRFCAVYVGRSMTVASTPSGWTLSTGCRTCPESYCSIISRSTGKPEHLFKCYKKNAYMHVGYTFVGTGWCAGTGGLFLNRMYKASTAGSQCKDTCDSDDNCIGYAHKPSNGECSVYGMMTSRGVGWHAVSENLNVISQASGTSGLSCYSYPNKPFKHCL